MISGLLKLSVLQFPRPENRDDVVYLPGWTCGIICHSLLALVGSLVVLGDFPGAQSIFQMIVTFKLVDFE